MKRLLYIVSLLTLFACHKAKEVEVRFVRCASMPAARASATAFAAEGKIYVLGGRDAHHRALADMWIYDPATDAWQQAPTPPLAGRVRGMALPVGDVVYLGLGSNGWVQADSCYLRDWWCYRPKTQEWKRLADYPTHNTVSAQAVCREGKICVLYGCYQGWTSDMMVYDITADRWTEGDVPDDSPKGGHGMAGAVCGKDLYMGTGYHITDDRQWWRWKAGNDDWEQCTAIPGKARSVASAAATTTYVYLMGGRHFGGDMSGGGVLDDIMRYDPSADQWAFAGTLPQGARENMSAVSVGDRVFFGLGENGECVTNDWYRIEE